MEIKKIVTPNAPDEKRLYITTYNERTLTCTANDMGEATKLLEEQIKGLKEEMPQNKEENLKTEEEN